MTDAVEKGFSMSPARNFRIGWANILNRSCAFHAALESILLGDPSQNPSSTASTRSGHSQLLFPARCVSRRIWRPRSLKLPSWSSSRAASARRLLSRSNIAFVAKVATNVQIDLMNVLQTSLITARARGNVAKPITLHRFVRPEIYRNRHRRRQPYEPLLEFEIGGGFL
jgi:hypothetical protein